MASDSRPGALPQSVLDAMPGAVVQLGPAGEVLGVNAAWRALAGLVLPAAGTNVTPGTDLLDAFDRAAQAGLDWAAGVAAALRAALAGQPGPIALELTLPADATTLWFEAIVTRLAGNGYAGALLTFLDISARKTAAEALRRTEAQYRAIVESAPVGIYQSAPDGRILAVNQSFVEIVAAASAAELIGTNISRFYADAGQRDALIARHRPETVSTPVEVEWRRLDGTPIAIEMAARAIADPAGGTQYWEGFVYDISERKRLEAQLMQAQKMESVGRLAGGIAHDFNNLLTVMIGYAELLHTADDLNEGYRPAAGEILAAARRAAELTGRMLAFARRQQVAPRAVLVNDVVRGVEGLLRRIIGEDIRLEVTLAADLPRVLIDPAQLEQVLMNLAVNARDAMPSGGTLTIATAAVEIGEDQARRQPGLRPGPKVRLVIADTGVGMDPETLARVFEPFFTTKEPGKGTGLGMAMCYGIVKQANGFITCESVKHSGTRCTVLLPPAAEGSAVAEPPGLEARTMPAAPAARAAILVVEDEPVVRQFVVDVLRSAGHEVHATGSAEEGLAIAATHPGLTLLLTDVVMPHMDGVQLAARVRMTRPGIRVLLMSGYQERRLVGDDTPALLLAKPFTAEQLRRRVMETLARGPSG